MHLQPYCFTTLDFIMTHSDKFIRAQKKPLVIVNKLNCRYVVGRRFTDHIPTTRSTLPTTYSTNHCQIPTDHLPTTSPSLPNTYRPHTDHVPTTYQPHTDHLYQPHTDSSTCSLLPEPFSHKFMVSGNGILDLG